jgi:hypothetical protein
VADILYLLTQLKEVGADLNMTYFQGNQQQLLKYLK